LTTFSGAQPEMATSNGALMEKAIMLRIDTSAAEVSQLDREQNMLRPGAPAQLCTPRARSTADDMADASWAQPDAFAFVIGRRDNQDSALRLGDDRGGVYLHRARPKLGIAEPGRHPLPSQAAASTYQPRCAEPDEACRSQATIMTPVPPAASTIR